MHEFCQMLHAYLSSFLHNKLDKFSHRYSNYCDKKKFFCQFPNIIYICICTAISILW